MVEVGIDLHKWRSASLRPFAALGLGAGRRLGAKAADGELIPAGSIIYRQRGTKIYPGVNVGMGKDHTLYALITGYVKFERKGRDKKQVSVYIEK